MTAFQLLKKMGTVKKGPKSFTVYNPTSTDIEPIRKKLAKDHPNLEVVYKEKSLKDPEPFVRIQKPVIVDEDTFTDWADED
jgi:hypothetical protein